MQKIRHLFVTSFRWRILINISISYVVAVIIYGLLSILLLHMNILGNTRIRDVICFMVAMIFFIISFLKLININFHYINQINQKIQQVTMGDYDTYCEIEYDDELGMVAANINALANTLKHKEEESAILKENERLAYDAERNAEKQKNELITNVAHDLRTPLTTIIGYLDLLRQNKNLDSDKVQEYANIGYDKALRLKSMMDDLFEFTKIDNPNMIMNLNIINIAELLLQMEDEFYPSFEEHDIKPEFIIPASTMNVVGDGQLLARVFENLISNALKYGYNHSTLKVEALTDDDTITVKVINEGDTINKEDIPYLFDKFYRTDESRGTSQGGTGLGLAIAKNIVKMHKGQILVTSRDHVTSFIVILARFHNEESEA